MGSCTPILEKKELFEGWGTPIGADRRRRNYQVRVTVTVFQPSPLGNWPIRTECFSDPAGYCSSAPLTSSFLRCQNVKSGIRKLLSAAPSRTIARRFPVRVSLRTRVDEVRAPGSGSGNAGSMATAGGRNSIRSSLCCC